MILSGVFLEVDVSIVDNEDSPNAIDEDSFVVYC